MYNKLSCLSISELIEITKNKFTRPAIEVVIAKALVRDAHEGGMNCTDRILDRIIGKVPVKTELTGLDGTPLVPPQINFEAGTDAKPDTQNIHAPEGPASPVPTEPV